MLLQVRGAAGHRAPEGMDGKMRRPKGGGRCRKSLEKNLSFFGAESGW